MKRGQDDEEDEMEPRQALPFGNGGNATGTCDWQAHVPSTAEEYLRMVRQEAAQVPDVVSKAVESSKSSSKSTFDQLAAQFEEVAFCRDDLMPSAEWEDCFLEFFASVRENYTRALASRSRLGASKNAKLPPSADEHQWLDLCFRGRSQPPTLSHIAKTDSRLRIEILWTLANILKKEKDDEALMRGQGGSWLFSLLVATDKPADPDTAAALRSIVRSLCARRAVLADAKTEELATLNILITVVGTFFGQLEPGAGRREAAHEQEQEWEEDEEWEGEEEVEEEVEEEGDQEEAGPQAREEEREEERDQEEEAGPQEIEVEIAE